MKRGSTKKGAERRKKARSRPRPRKESRPHAPTTPSKALANARAREASGASVQSVPGVEFECCHHCGKALETDQRAVFVEEEVGRVFCAEDCIAAYFAPEIERLEKEYFRRLSSSDLSVTERESLAHLRWITLQEPDEVWREKTLVGDLRYTMISEFQPGEKKVWSVCICLFLRGEPSFLYLAFPTRNQALVAQYRRGERVRFEPNARSKDKAPQAEGDQVADPSDGGGAHLTDRLADGWTEDETYRAQMSLERRGDDIPAADFKLYESCLDETLEEPDEVWSMRMGDASPDGMPAAQPEPQPEGGLGSEEDALRVFHFIRHYPEEKPGMWYVIVARETENEEQIEILDAFPTRDAELVARYRKGEREFGTDGESESPSASRVVH